MKHDAGGGNPAPHFLTASAAKRQKGKKMAYYDVKHCCGHTECVQLYGPTKNREWRIHQMEQELCSECWAAELARRNAENAKKAREMELPPLQGTEKQVAWAETLRMEFIAEYERDYANRPMRVDPMLENCSNDEYAEAALKESRASWWIDHKDSMWTWTLIHEVVEAARKKYVANPLQKAALAEMTMKPADGEHAQDAVITLEHKENYIIAKCEARNKAFVSVAKDLGYQWNSVGHCWLFKISAFTGSAEDRMAELGSKLLTAGLTIIVSDDNVRQKIIAGDYEPIYPRWLVKASETLLLRWERGNDKLYATAKALPSAKWSHELSGITLSPKYYKSISDFIRAYDVHVTPEAQALMDVCKEVEKQALLVKPKVKQAPAAKANGAEDLMRDRDVLPDLKEDDDD